MSDQNQDPGPTVASPAAQLYDSMQIPPDSQFIRVLDISAKSSATNESLTGSLSIVDLKDSPRFTALSYVWGESSGKSITCNGYNVRVTDSCFEALSSLRQSLGSFTIWVDAVCINQKDDDEKAAQIQLMEQIYTWAEAVYIWMGPSTETTKKGLECIRLGSRYRLFLMGIPWRSGNRLVTMFQEYISFCKRGLIALYFQDIKERCLLLIGTYGLMRIFFPTFYLILTGTFYPSRLFILTFTLILALIFLIFALIFGLILIRICAFSILCAVPLRSSELVISKTFDFALQLAVASVNKLYILFRRFSERRLTLEWASLLGITNQRWLQRSWTFQEIALASNPILVFGQDHISWLELHQGLAWAHDLGHKDRGSLDPPPDYMVLQTIKKWLSLCNVWQTLPRPCRWNGHRFREVLDKPANFRDDCSVREYLETSRASLLLALIETCEIFFVALFSLFTGHLKPPENGIDGKIGLYEVAFDFLCHVLPFIITFFAMPPKPWQRLRIIGMPMDFDRRSHLVGIVQAMRERECSLKKDRVFAIKAILQRLGICQPTADYSRSTGEIYHESFAGLVEWEPSFISLLIDTGSRLPGAPSWVPDWSTVAERCWLSSAYVYDPVQVPQWSREELSISISRSILSVQAAFLRASTHCTVPFRKVQVDSAGDAIPGMEESLIHNIQTLSQWVMRVRNDMLVDSIYDSIPLGVLSVLSGHHIDHSELDPDTRQVFNKVYTLMRRHSAQLNIQLATMTGITTATRATFHYMAADKPTLAFIIGACNQLAGKRGLFLCSDGSIGSGPGDMLEGDSIVFIKGVAVPMVLRRQSDGAQRDVYTVVGPSFIEGLMGLDAKGLEKKKLDWKQIDLA